MKSVIASASFRTRLGRFFAHSGTLLCLMVGAVDAEAQEASESGEAATQPGPEPAEQPPALRGPPAAALEHYNLGRAHYQAGRYREAVVELEQALRADPSSPNLVYNVARVYELLGEIDRAIDFYRRYHGMLPVDQVEERERISLILQRLEGARQHTVVEPPSPPPPVEAPVERKRGVADPAFWTLASFGAAALGAGAVTGVFALRAEDTARKFRLGDDGSYAQRQREVEHADRLALISDAVLLVGATLGVTAILLYALREEPVAVAPRARIGLGFTREGAVLSIGGSL